MKNKKIVHLITRIDYGGSAENTFLSAAEFVKRGYDVSIWAGTGSDLPRNIEKDANEAGVHLCFIPELMRSIRPFMDLKAYLKIRKRLKQEKPAVLHTHTSKAGFIGRLAGKCAKVPVVVHTAHGHIYYGYFSSLKTSLFVFLERIASLFCDAIISLTEREIEENLERKIGNVKKQVCIPSGIDFNHIKDCSDLAGDFKKKLDLTRETVVLGSLGRFVPIKGFDLIVKSAPKVIRECPNAYFYLAGTGPEKEKLVELIKETQMDRYFYVDDFKEISEGLGLIDVFLLPSRNEGQSRTLIEAMFLKKIVLVSNAGGLTSVVQNNINGFVFSSGDDQDLANKIIYILKNIKDLKGLSVAAHDSVVNRYNIETMISKLEELYTAKMREKNG